MLISDQAGSASGLYRATPKIAFRGVKAFVNPFADDFSLARFLLGVGGALVLAGAWPALAENFELENLLRSSLGFLPDKFFQPALFGPGFILSGLFIGWQFPQKGFLRGFLSSLPALFLMPEKIPHPLYFSLLSAFAGSIANRLNRSVKEWIS